MIAGTVPRVGNCFHARIGEWRPGKRRVVSGHKQNIELHRAAASDKARPGNMQKTALANEAAFLFGLRHVTVVRFIGNAFLPSL